MKLIVNFKTYQQGTGKAAVNLSQAIADYVKERSLSQIEIGVAPQLVDLKQIAKACSNLELWSQAIDPINYGSHTGSILPEAVADCVTGSIINHSEKRLPFKQIEQAVERCHQVNIWSLVCVQDPEEAERVAKLEPDLIAYEPPELIGGDTSVAEAKPSLVKEAVSRVESTAGNDKIKVLTGAGIKDRKDVDKALELGTQGILIASGIVKNKKPVEALRNLLKGFDQPTK